MKPRVEFFVIGQLRAQDKALEKPARMGQVPFRGADIGHALDDRVLGRQRFDQFLGLAPDSTISARQGARFGGRLLLWLRGIHDPIRISGHIGYRLPQSAVKAKEYQTPQTPLFLDSKRVLAFNTRLFWPQKGYAAITFWPDSSVGRAAD